MISAVLFDLDGTLADTAPDLGYALNLLRSRHGKDVLPLPRIRPHVSHGARGMLEVGFGILPDDPKFGMLKDEFLELYAQNVCRETRLFPGMLKLLDALEAKRVLWGVVTNKPSRFTEPLVDSLQLRERAACVVSGDSRPRAKPHPDTLLAACEQLAIACSECLYIGDDERDVIAARAAGIPAIVAMYGYLGAGTHPDLWGAHGKIEHPGELLGFLDR